MVIDPVNLPQVNVSSIGATNWAGGVSATEHLISLGHDRIAFIGGPPDVACNQARLHGYRAALENAGIAFNATLVGHGGFNYATASSTRSTCSTSNAAAQPLFSLVVTPLPSA